MRSIACDTTWHPHAIGKFYKKGPQSLRSFPPKFEKMKFEIAIAALVAVPAVLAVAPYGQCGGKAYTGADKTCTSGYNCVYVSDWYSQCRPAPSPSPSPSPSPRVSPSPSPQVNANSLHGRMKAKGKKYFGNIVDQNTITNTVVTNILKQEFGAITAEWSMKMEAIQANQGVYTWGGADAVANFAQQNGMLLRGHAIIWHVNLPQWVQNINNRNTLTTVIQDYTTQVLSRYRGKAYHWDIVNECLADDGSMRDTHYYRVFGEDYISIAFRAARAADPNTKLYINDYTLDGPTWPKVTSIVDKVKRWKAAGVPIDGIGSQVHITERGVSRQVQGALEKLATAGVEVAITELDIWDAPAQEYADVVKACLSVPQCVGISAWGVRDSDSWIKERSPLMFDSNGNKKAAYTAAYNALA